MRHFESTHIVRGALGVIVLLLAMGLLAQFLVDLSGGRVMAQAPPELRLRLAVTDGWAYTLESGPYYILGLVPVPEGATHDELLAYRGQAQLPAPTVIAEEGQTLRLTLTNIGPATPSDEATPQPLRWRGFPGVLSFADGSPTGIVELPAGANFTCYSKLPPPGTYLWDYGIEAVAGTQRSMVGALIVHPAQDGRDGRNDDLVGRYAYNDGNGLTAYDREFVLLFSEVKEPGEQEPTCRLLNGRAFPQTLLPEGELDLPSQPMGSAMRVNSGERILLRVLNAGSEPHTLQLPGIPLRVIGKDARLLRGRDGVDLTFWTNTLAIQSGEAYDLLLTAPPVTEPSTARLMNRQYDQLATTDTLDQGVAAKIVIYPRETPIE